MAGQNFTVDNESAMAALAAELAPQLLGASMVYLNGPLGAGKTTFVRGLLQHLGVATVVKSPTYTLVESYDYQGRVIHHFDLYRLLVPDQLEEIGLDHYLAGNSICLVEWPEKGTGFLPAGDRVLTFSYHDNGARRLAIA